MKPGSLQAAVKTLPDQPYRWSNKCFKAEPILTYFSDPACPETTLSVYCQFVLW